MSDAESMNMLMTFYQEVCKSHDEITNFRAKLLALLPIASGAGFFLVPKPDASESLALPLALFGIFGGLATFGLFLYELRGMEKCHALRSGGKKLEKMLLKENVELGRFTAEKEGLWHDKVGAIGAALLIYPAVVGVWIYVICSGLKVFQSSITLPLEALPMATGFVVTLAVGMKIRRIQDCKRKSARFAHLEM